MEHTSDISPSKELINQFNSEMAWKYEVLPMDFTDGKWTLIASDQLDVKIKRELGILLGTAPIFKEAPKQDIIRWLNLYYRKDKQAVEYERVAASQAEQFVHNLIEEAKSLNSSDIHVEVFDLSARVRIRIDGILVERHRIPIDDYPAIVNRIKIISGLDIAERRLPQDGRISIQIDTGAIDLRVSILPTIKGEKIVLRLLQKDATRLDIAHLGMDSKQLQMFEEALRKPHGIILLSGPTGSGKTTTLYAALKMLNEEKRNIMTVEDPVEYTLPGVNQVHMRENIGLSFSATLRSFLRQDPDVIMVGEIRDEETADIAVRAALTGHLVLSTIHTNSAWGIVSRLVNMGISPYMISNTLNSFIAQRLVRKLCDHCKTEVVIKAEDLPSSWRNQLQEFEAYKANGCHECHFTGYSGRIALYEIIPVNPEIATAIRQEAADIPDLRSKYGISRLNEQAFELFCKGISSLEEIYPLLY